MAREHLNPPVREAVRKMRDQGHSIEVRVTWEGGDAARFADEARTDGVDILIAGGGDGTLNEALKRRLPIILPPDTPLLQN